MLTNVKYNNKCDHVCVVATDPTTVLSVALSVTLTGKAHAHASLTYVLDKVHGHTITSVQQSHMRTLTRNVVPATGFAVSTLELLATTSGHDVPLPVYSSAMLQAVSPCSR